MDTNNNNLTVEQQLDEISGWLKANAERIKKSDSSVSFVHYRNEDDGRRCSATQLITKYDLLSLLDLCLTNLKSIIDPDEDYNSFLATAFVLLSVIHKKQGLSDMTDK